MFHCTIHSSAVTATGKSLYEMMTNTAGKYVTLDTESEGAHREAQGCPTPYP